MKFFLLVAFLFFCSQSAWAADPCSGHKKGSLAERYCQQRAEAEARRAESGRYCPQGEKMSKVISVMNQFPDQYKVNHKGAYVDSVFWRMTPLETKEEMARIFAMYQNCHIFKMSDWAPSIDIFDNRSGKKIGKLSLWSGYVAE